MSIKTTIDLVREFELRIIGNGRTTETNRGGEPIAITHNGYTVSYVGGGKKISGDGLYVSCSITNQIDFISGDRKTLEKVLSKEL